MDYNDIPRFSEDLIKYLDQTIPVVELPTSINQLTALLTSENLLRLAWQAGRRSLVEDLVLGMNDERRQVGDEYASPAWNAEDQGAPHDTGLGYARVLGSDGGVRAVPVEKWLDALSVKRGVASRDS